jgi:hypothetical protein
LLELNEKALCFTPSRKWEKVKEPKFFELVSRSESSKTQAGDLCKAENELYEQALLSGHAYSLIFGPCENHITRVCILRGLWRTDSKKVISAPS